MNEDAVADLPLNGRNYIDLTFLQAGIAKNENMSSGGTFVGSWFSSNGAPMRSNSYMLDGAVMGNALGGSAGSMAGTTLGIEGIQEFDSGVGRYRRSWLPDRDDAALRAGGGRHRRAPARADHSA